MLDFIINNLSTIIVSLILLSIVILVIKIIIDNKNNGKSSCGGGCSGCPNACMCHKIDDTHQN